MGGKFQREGTYVYLWLIHIAVWQKPTQHCKTIIFQFKMKKKKKKENKLFIDQIFWSMSLEEKSDYTTIFYTY